MEKALTLGKEIRDKKSAALSLNLLARVTNTPPGTALRTSQGED
jgi:hypothetical protein